MSKTKKTNVKQSKKGRPDKYDSEFYQNIIEEYDIKKYSVDKIAHYHNVTVQTVNRWLKKAREKDGQEKS